MKVRFRRLAPTLIATTLLAIALAPGMANAAWYLAQSKHFNVYSDVSDFDTKSFTSKLELFDTLLRSRNGLKDTDHPRRLDIYLVRGQTELHQVWNHDGVAGFYWPNEDVTFAIAINREARAGPTDVLFHEYVHHFMLQNFAYPYSAWLVEGYAEYFGYTKITDEAIVTGGSNPSRDSVLIDRSWIPIGDVLTKRYNAFKGDEAYSYYPEAWLLTHYLMSDPQRRAQLADYIERIARGEPGDKAMAAATGQSLDQLTAALRAYTHQGLAGLRYPLKAPPSAPVSFTQLPHVADDLLLLSVNVGRRSNIDLSSLDSRVGAGAPDQAAARRAEEQDLLQEVRQRAAHYPGERLADLTLAEAEVKFGDRLAGETVLKRYLAANPNDVDALWLMGLGQVLAAKRDRAHRDQYYVTARPLLAKAMQLDPDRYPPFYAYAATWSADVLYPSPEAVEALKTAHRLAPQVGEITVSLGAALLRQGSIVDGDRVLLLESNDPHAGALAQRAADLLQHKPAVTAPGQN